MLLLGVLEDNVYHIALGNLYRIFGSNSIKFFPMYRSYPVVPYENSQPLSFDLFFFLSRFAPSIAVYNIFTLTAAIMGLIVGYKFYKAFIRNSYLSLLLSVILLGSPYFYYHARSHHDLSQYWLLLIGMYATIFYNERLEQKGWGFRSLILGALFGLVTVFSNYYGFFLLMFHAIYISIYSLLYKRYKSRLLLLFKSSLISLVPFFLLGVFFLRNYLLLLRTSLTDFTTPARTLEDFFYFTSRPWYFLLPPIDNPLLGKLSSSALSYLQDDWGYWLTGNFFKQEHSASYIGYSVLFLSLLGVCRTLFPRGRLSFVACRKVFSLFSRTSKAYTSQARARPVYRKEVYLMHKNILISLALSTVVLFSLTMPPYFTIALHKIYTPSYVSYLMFPMFRSLVRLSELINIIVLIFAGYGLLFFNSWADFTIAAKFPKMSERTRAFIISLFVFVITVFAVSEKYIPLKVTKYSYPPSILSYIKENLPKDSVIAVYPFSNVNEYMFWISYTQRPIINPRGFGQGSFGFESDKFTENLVSCEGMQEAIDLGVGYVLVYNISSLSSRIVDFITHNQFLKQLYVYKTNISGEDSFSQEIILYKIEKDSFLVSSCYN
ncbi:hypothetical protein H6802_04285 [Candidatus Nomurabacteria bacterium]|uniref:Uncharacterized protein n=1 Tax=candidate division WWE3 bacterium TaxID=2053526 RepID=A0A955E1P7_UNCKA|nr:hypothetical protein [candidate division WWE3 bacterium]MCB9824137.1 hypothetical protein [Candidatus Nomurabacteria bacterium]MCB9828078.1 hypothetical protein [Candidatus Nomurabacteria bacterium]HXK52626.1 hypothetical protein [bacterium]